MLQMIWGSFKNVTNKMETKPDQTKPIYMFTNYVYLYSYKQDLVLNNLPTRLIWRKT